MVKTNEIYKINMYIILSINIEYLNNLGRLRLPEIGLELWLKD
jgi:hypothetical protein